MVSNFVNLFNQINMLVNNSSTRGNLGQNNVGGNYANSSIFNAQGGNAVQNGRILIFRMMHKFNKASL